MFGRSSMVVKWEFVPPSESQSGESPITVTVLFGGQNFLLSRQLRWCLLDRTGRSVDAREKRGLFICSVGIGERSHKRFRQFFWKARSSFFRRLRRCLHEWISRLRVDLRLTESLETFVFMMYGLKLFCCGHCRPESDFGQTCFSHLALSELPESSRFLVLGC
jgi:hypothetical protein